MGILRYFKLFLAFFRFSFSTETAFRGNLAFYTIQNILWLGLMLLGIELIYGKVNSFAGWDKQETYLLLFVGALFNDLLWTLVLRNLHYFSHLVRMGLLDQILLKPVNTRFILSLKTIEFDHFLRIVVDLIFIWKFTVLLANPLSILNILAFLILFLCGFIMIYSLFFAITTTNIWLTNITNLNNLFEQIRDVGEKPVYIFKKSFFILFAYIIPVGFIATFPTEALLGKIDTTKIIMGIFLALLFLLASQKFFQFAIKYYSSASS